jgi:hypothetical protein
MDDIFARIGVAIARLTDNSSINGTPKEEVHRLAQELQEFEGSLNTIVDTRVAARVEAFMAETTAYVDDRFLKLAVSMETAGVSIEGTAPVGSSPVEPEEPTHSEQSESGEETSAPPESEPSADATEGSAVEPEKDAGGPAPDAVIENAGNESPLDTIALAQDVVAKPGKKG